jgi:uncharacterized DUF497 family protein
MDFEFDPAKSEINKDKHGIDFIEAQELWKNPVFNVKLPVSAEARELNIGHIGEKYWAAITTRRKTYIRIISVRRARKKEVDIYEQQKQDHQ